MKFNHKKRPIVGYITQYKNKMQLIERIIEWEQWALGQEKELRDYISFVDDGLRSHGKPKEVMIKYKIYKEILGELKK